MLSLPLETILSLHLLVLKYLGVRLNDKFLRKEFLDIYSDESLDDQVIYQSFAQKYEEDLSAWSVRDNTRLLFHCQNINKQMQYIERLHLLLVLVVEAFEEGKEKEANGILFNIAEAFNIPEEDFDALILIGEIFANEKELNYHKQLARLGKGIFTIDGQQEYALIFKPFQQGKFLFLVSNDSQNEYEVNERIWQREIFLFENSDTLLWNGKKLYFSDLQKLFIQQGKTEEEAFSFLAQEISFKFGEGAFGIHPFSFKANAGNLVSIMGPSGAGKSTLVELLNGTLQPNAGTVLWDGADIHAYENEGLRQLIGYVPQDDLLIEELSVFENLYYAYRLINSVDTKLNIEENINAVLDRLGIAHIAHLKVGNALSRTISGGERKRVNIALELIRKPKVLFLDEPTSGLSSKNSELIIELLRKLATEEKMLIFVVIHQPGSGIFKLFDKLLLMDVGGYIIYDGKPLNVFQYLSNRLNISSAKFEICNTCEVVQPDTIFELVEAKKINAQGEQSRQRVRSPYDWYQSYRERFERKQASELLPSFGDGLHKQAEHTPKLWQCKYFLRRDLNAKFKNVQYLTINALQTPLLAIFLAFANRYSDNESKIGYLFSDNPNLPAWFFISVILALFTGLTLSAEEIFHDRKIIKRERSLGLSRGSYLLSKLFVQFGVSAILMASFALIGNLILEIPSFSLETWLILFSVSCFANVLGLLISDTLNSAVTIYIMVPVLLIPQLLFGGVVLKFHQMNSSISNGVYVPVLGNVMVARWAYEAFCTKQQTENGYQLHFYEAEAKIAQAESRLNFLYPALNGLLEELKFYKNAELIEERNRVSRATLVLNNTLYKEMAIAGIQNNNLDAEMRLNALKLYYQKRFAEGLKEKEAALQALNRELGEGAAFTISKAFSNKYLLDLVRGRPTDRYLQELDNTLFIVTDAIYNTEPPIDGNALKTVFFTPKKRLMGYELATFWFNIGVIWFLSFLLYLVLYFRWLYKLLRIVPSYLAKKKRNQQFE